MVDANETILPIQMPPAEVMVENLIRANAAIAAQLETATSELDALKVRVEKIDLKEFKVRALAAFDTYEAAWRKVHKPTASSLADHIAIGNARDIVLELLTKPLVVMLVDSTSTRVDVDG